MFSADKFASDHSRVGGCQRWLTWITTDQRLCRSFSLYHYWIALITLLENAWSIWMVHEFVQQEQFIKPKNQHTCVLKCFAAASKISSFHNIQRKKKASCTSFGSDYITSELFLWWSRSGSKFTEWGDQLNEDGDQLNFRMKIILGTVLVLLLVFPVVSREVSGIVPGWTQNCELRRKSTTFDRTPRIRPSVLLNSWDKFSVTLLSRSSERCVM